MNKSMFDGMIGKYREGKYAGKQKAMFDQWFDIQQLDESVEVWTQDAKHAVKVKILEAIDGPVRDNERYEKVDKVQQERRQPRETLAINSWFRAAAAVLIMAIVVYLAWINKTGEMFPVASERVTKVMLVDGSIVWLKGKDSKLIHPDTFAGSERHVSLQGEALFEVANDPQRPFIIQCAGFRAMAQGTSFNIRTDTRNTEMIVLAGTVSVRVDEDKKTTVVQANEKVIYNDTQKQFIKEVTEQAAVHAVVKGTRYFMAFQETRMGEIIPHIEDKFGVAISVTDRSLCNCLVTADFTGKSLNGTLDMLRITSNLDYTMDGNKVLLDGNGCD